MSKMLYFKVFLFVLVTIVLQLVHASLLISTSTCLLPRQDQVSFAACPAAAWPPKGPGSVIESTLPDADLTAALEDISVDNIRSYIERLVSFGTRHTLSNQTDPNRGIGAARDWIAATMREWAAVSNGSMTVDVPGYIQQPDGSRITFPVKISNVVATLKGTTTPDRYYVVSGHYDSRVTDVLDYTSDSPGADDDASGVAVSMEMARVMSTRQSRSTLVFMAVAGEEQGLFGSQFQAQTYKNASINVAAMLNNDIVGSPTSDDNTTDPHTLRLFAQGPPLTESPTVSTRRLSIGGENDSPARELARYIISTAQNTVTGITRIALEYRLDRYLRSGDQRPFLEAGFPAIRFTEPRENFAHQHQDVRVGSSSNGGSIQYGDLPTFVDYEYVARVARTNLAAMYSMAQAPAIPSNVTINAAVLENVSRLQWDVPVNEEEGVAGYEVVYRPTAAPLWMYSYDVGKVRNVTVPVSKDSNILGVRSVGVNGYRSPAAFTLEVISS